MPLAHLPLEMSGSEHIGNIFYVLRLLWRHSSVSLTWHFSILGARMVFVLWRTCPPDCWGPRKFSWGRSIIWTYITLKNRFLAPKKSGEILLTLLALFYQNPYLSGYESSGNSLGRNFRKCLSSKFWAPVTYGVQRATLQGFMGYHLQIIFFAGS